MRASRHNARIGRYQNRGFHLAALCKKNIKIKTYGEESALILYSARDFAMTHTSFII